MGLNDVVIGCIVFLSVLLNTILLVVLLKQRPVNQPKNVILMSLTISALLQGLFAYPIELYTILDGQTTDTVHCRLSAILVFGLSLVAIWSLTLLAIERLLSVKYPFVKERLLVNSHKWLIMSILMTWLLSAFWAIIPLFGWSSYVLETQNEHRCNINLRNYDANTLSYTYALLFTCFVIPVTVMAYCIYNVKCELKGMIQAAILSSGASSKLSIDTHKIERRQSILFFVMIFSFIVAWTPYAIIVVILTFNKEIPLLLYKISALLAKSSSCYNALIYGFVYKDLRRILTNMLRSTRVSPSIAT